MKLSKRIILSLCVCMAFYATSATLLFPNDDGISETLSEPVFYVFLAVGLVFSAIFCLAAYCVGLLLRIRKLATLWRSLGYWSLVLMVPAAVMIALETKEMYAILETGGNMQICPLNVWPFYILAIFPIVNWPNRKPNQALLPTPMSVTDRADARSAPATGAADL
jgi:tryptophan-rich sensory protein